MKGKLAEVCITVVMGMLYPFQKLCKFLCKLTGKRNTFFARGAVELTALVMVAEIARNVIRDLEWYVWFDVLVTFGILLAGRPFMLRRIEAMDRWLDNPDSGRLPITPADAYAYVLWTFLYGMMGVMWLPLLWEKGDPFALRCLGTVMSIGFLLAPNSGGKKERAVVPVFQGI